MTSKPLSKDNPEAELPVLLFDGDCAFCQYWVIYIVRRDLKRIFYFSPLSPYWEEELMGHTGAQKLPETVAVWDGQTLRTESTAVIYILKHLGGIYKWAGIILWVVPPFIRDFIYRWVAKNRKKLKQNCEIPPHEIRNELNKRTIFKNLE